MNNKRVYILKEYIIKEIKSLIKEENVLITRRTPEEREKNYIIATQKKIQQYIKDGSEGSLNLSGAPITSLPDNLTVNGEFNLMNTKITSLPDNLTKVEGTLNLFKTLITSLPDNLKVNDGLNLGQAPITSLPNNLTVGGELFLRDTPISKKYTKKQLKRMLPGVKYIYI
jgi:hypothetical protein